ncbi:hypothetical protein [Pseudomonas sp. 910_21]|uniref:hypothetical protein n=1 Tax=Pseudomonas sp. 910_21 TaxID=2604460 RepID=UPI0040634BB2
MSIDPINIGGVPNDGNGQDLRSGGQIINDNFAELDTRTAAAQEKAEQGVLDAAAAHAAAEAAKSKADAAVPGAAVGISVAQLVSGVVPASQLPSFVDDVLEFPARVDFPAVGETGKIYIAINDGDSPTNPTRQYRWSGSAYVLIPSSPGSTDQVPEGSTNQYFTAARVRAVTLAGLGSLVNAAILATDTVLQAFAKLQGQLNAKLGKNEKAVDSDKLDGQLASFYTAIMTGATASTPGTNGLVPAPPAGAAVRVLSSLGTWIAQATGSTWGSITGTLSSQADLNAALAAKQDTSTAPLTKRYTSTPQQFVAGGQSVWTHNLGKEVAVVEAWMRCKTAEIGYSVGDKLPYPAMGTDNGGSTGLSVVCTSTTATVRMGSGSFIMLQKASGTTTFFTAANWEIYLEIMG